MKLLRDFPRSTVNRDFHTSITIGTFDGIHIGHRRILQEVISEAEKTGAKSLVVTFDRHPLSVLKQDFSPRLISTLDEKLPIFEKIGIDITYIMPFTKQVSELTAEQFIKDYLIDCLGMGTLISGYDHGFGKRREGSPETFQELARKLNFSLKTVCPVEHDGIIVKSSTIRSMLSDGNVEGASKLLGAEYSLKGRVIKGNRLGKKIGIPTANVKPENKGKILPAPGVYAGWVEFEGIRRRAVVNLGARPTFDIEKEALETHLIEFSGNLYGKEVRLGFIRRLRDIVKFSTQDDLKLQINSDIEITKELISS